MVVDYDEEGIKGNAILSRARFCSISIKWGHLTIWTLDFCYD